MGSAEEGSLAEGPLAHPTAVLLLRRGESRKVGHGVTTANPGVQPMTSLSMLLKPVSPPPCQGERRPRPAQFGIWGRAK